MTAPVEQARVAAEAIRVLNRATIRRRGYVWPGDVDAVLGELVVLAERLPQALEQAAGWLTRAYLEGRVGHDSALQTAGDAVDEVLAHLQVAQSDAANLAQELRIARASSSHLTGLCSSPGAGDDADA